MNILVINNKFKILWCLWRNQRIQCQSPWLPALGKIPQCKVLALLTAFSSKSYSLRLVAKIQLQPRPGREHIISNYSFRWDLSGFAWAKAWEPVSRGENSWAPTPQVVASPSFPVPRACRRLCPHRAPCFAKRAVLLHCELSGSIPAPSSSPQPHKHPGADTLCPHSLFIKPHFQQVWAGAGQLHGSNYGSQAVQQEGAALEEMVQGQ